MSERILYRGCGDFQGSIDEEGRLYDENHRLVGRIEGNDVYDYCNIKQGTIDENGNLWDCNHAFVGQRVGGRNFASQSYQSTGMVRGDGVDEGDGTEYGALMMLKKRNRQYSGEILDDDYEFGNGDSCEYCDDGGMVEESDHGGWFDCDSHPENREEYRQQAAEPVRPTPRISLKQRWEACRDGKSSVPPDSFFSTGKKDEYEVNGLKYVDVSRKSTFWGAIAAFFAGLSGKAVVTEWDKMTGTWDGMKREAVR